MNFAENGRIINLGIVGLGGRGRGWTKALLDMKDVNVTAVCDIYQDRIDETCQMVEKGRGKKPFATTDYHELVAREDIEAVLIFANWEIHARVAAAALRTGKRVGIEVGGAASIEECWEMVKLSELHKTPVMFLENCCYGRDELTVLNMERQGMFGELVHCHGGYQHDLREEIGWGDVKRHYRQNHFMHRNGELYPMHALGPIAKLLRINRGNRMVTLTAMASKAVGLHEWYLKNRPGDPLTERVVAEGDIVTTLIKCAGGETIVLTHDCTLPRPYSRAGRVQGTKGIWMEDKHAYYLEGVHPSHEWVSFDEALEKNTHPLWKAFAESDREGTHGGMDYLVMRAFVESVQKRENPPIDVYDAAAWMAITCLSEQSIALGGMPVAIPDFTNGSWINRTDDVPGQYALL